MNAMLFCFGGHSCVSWGGLKLSMLQKVTLNFLSSWSAGITARCITICTVWGSNSRFWASCPLPTELYPGPGFLGALPYFSSKAMFYCPETDVEVLGCELWLRMDVLKNFTTVMFSYWQTLVCCSQTLESRCFD